MTRGIVQGGRRPCDALRNAESYSAASTRVLSAKYGDGFSTPRRRTGQGEVSAAASPFLRSPASAGCHPCGSRPRACRRMQVLPHAVASILDVKVRRCLGCRGGSRQVPCFLRGRARARRWRRACKACKKLVRNAVFPIVFTNFAKSIRLLPNRGRGMGGYILKGVYYDALTLTL